MGAGNPYFSPDSAITMTYGILNRVDSVQQTVGGQTYAISYGYDASGNRTQMITPWGSTSYTYDALNRLISLANPDGKTVTFAYDAIGRRTRLTLPNGTETTYAYDAASQLTQILHRKTIDNTALAFSNYVYDLAGNRTGMQDLTGAHGYGYDDLHRLTEASHPGQPTETFAYDKVGNRTADAVMTGYQYNAGNRLLENSSYTYTYDNNGNLTGQTHKTTGDHTTYAYTSENQLKQVTMPVGSVITFKYDPMGRRIEKVSANGTFRYVYDNEDIIAVLDGNNTVTANITHGPGIDEPLIMKKGAENYYYHADGLGSIVALSDSAGAIVETMEYSAYGKPVFKDAGGAIITGSAVGSPYSYTAREYDPETGLFYYRARYYSAEIGGFLQEDPIKMDSIFGKSDYRYANNNPVINVDPSGRKCVSTGFKTRMPPVTITHPPQIGGWQYAHPITREEYNSAFFKPDEGTFALISIVRLVGCVFKRTITTKSYTFIPVEWEYLCITKCPLSIYTKRAIGSYEDYRENIDRKQEQITIKRNVAFSQGSSGDFERACSE